jgi:hypothetical protein
MTALLIGMLERVSPRGRRIVVAIAALLALGVVMAALTRSGPRDGRCADPSQPISRWPGFTRPARQR